MTWDDVIDKAEGERFVGREQELFLFRTHIERKPPRYLIFFITGQGGAGKTTLFNRYREIVQDAGFLLADCDEQQHNVPEMLGRFAHQLANQGFTLKHFDERYKVYRQKLDEIEQDPDAPEGLAAMVGRTMVRGVYIAGDLVPGLRKGLEYLPQESIENQASEWATYLTKRLTNKDEVALLREPDKVLTPLFFKDLNEIAERRRVLLCFENYEQTRDDLQVWLLRLRDYKPSQNIRIVIASRNPPGAKWDSLRSVTLTISLDLFTEQEAEQFLDTYSVINVKRRSEILEFSGRLPVLMSWLAAPEGNEPDPLVPVSDIVDQFLRWVTSPEMRRAALLLAIPQNFNLDIITLLLQRKGASSNSSATFDWLRTMPFVKMHSDGWQYHPVVRRMMLHYQRQESPKIYRQNHAKLLSFYDKKRSALGLSDKQLLSNKQWRMNTLNYIYHSLAADLYKHWPETMSLFSIAVIKQRDFAIEIMEWLNLDDIRDELPEEQNSIVQLFLQQLRSIQEKGHLSDGFKMFDKLCSMTNLTAEAKAYALTCRSRCYRKSRKWEETLADIDRAIELAPDIAWSKAVRSELCYRIRRYEEAIVASNSAIELNPNYHWAYEQKGKALTVLGRYGEAVQSLTQAAKIDPECSSCVARRALAYQYMGQYEKARIDLDLALALSPLSSVVIAVQGEYHRRTDQYEAALADFNRAIELDPEEVWAIGRRAEIYRQRGQYEAALADFNRAIEIDPDVVWAIGRRAETYRQMGQYEAALADFNRAIEIDPDVVWAIGRRAEIYRQMGRYETALAHFNQAIEHAPKEDWNWYCRAIVWLSLNNVDAFNSDLNVAITLAQIALQETPKDHRVGFNLALYNLAAGNLGEAKEQYEQLELACTSVERLRAAMGDLDTLIDIQPSNELARHIRERIEKILSKIQLSVSY